MSKKGAYSKRRSPLLREVLKICLFLMYAFFSVPILAQTYSDLQKTIYTGLDTPTSIYATQQHLFVVESGKHRILKLDHNGKLLETLGGLGTGDYQLDTPIDIDATNGLKIYVSDYRNNRVQVFDKRFQYLTTIIAPREQRSIRPTQLVVNDFGELFFYDEASKAILRYDEKGNFLNSFSVPESLKKISNLRLIDGWISVIDTERMVVLRISENGVIGEEFPFFFYDGENHIDEAFAKVYRFDLLKTVIKKAILTDD